MSSSAMLTPEKLLTQLNAALRRLLSASAALQDPKIEKELEPVLRRLLLAEVMGTHSIIAIGGSQGAGKTTIVSRLYNLDANEQNTQRPADCWLVPNEGRGETSPVLIEEEAGRTCPAGEIRKFSPDDGTIKDERLEQERFRRALGNLEAGQLLPILKVPQQFFDSPRQGWLLLPGYETMRRENRIWQLLMRQGLVAATACVIVTDQTRMASASQNAIVQDMMASDLDGAHVCVIVSKTEGLRDKPEEQEALQRRAGEIFHVPEDRVICTGTTDQEYIDEWLPKLRNLIKQVAASGGGNRKKQIQQLAEILKTDLNQALSGIREKVQIFSHEKKSKISGPNSTVLGYLEAFDDAAENLRHEYTRKVQLVLDKHRIKAWKSLDRNLESREGIINAIFTIFGGHDSREAEKALEEAWETSGPILQEYADVLGELTRQSLGYPKKATIPALGCDASLGRQLGYVDSDGNAIKWAKPSETDTRNLEIIFGKSSDKPDENLRNSIALLPALTLEYARIACFQPETVGVSATRLQALPDDTRMQEIQKSISILDKTLGQGKTLASTVIGLFATEGVVALGGIGGAVAATVAVGPLAYYALQGVRRADVRKRAQAFEALQAVRDEYLIHFLEHFDRMIARSREALRSSLRQRYNLDTALMQCDWLEKTLVDVQSLRGELLEMLSLSGDAIDLFNEPADVDSLQGAHM